MKESITYKELMKYLEKCYKSLTMLMDVNIDPEALQPIYDKLNAAVIIAEDLFGWKSKNG